MDAPEVLVDRRWKGCQLQEVDQGFWICGQAVHRRLAGVESWTRQGQGAMHRSTAMACRPLQESLQSLLEVWRSRCLLRSQERQALSFLYLLQADALMLRKSAPGAAVTQFTCMVDTAVYSRCGASAFQTIGSFSVIPVLQCTLLPSCLWLRERCDARGGLLLRNSMTPQHTFTAESVAQRCLLAGARRNRHFRLLWSCKGGKRAVLLPSSRFATGPGGAGAPCDVDDFGVQKLPTPALRLHAWSSQRFR